MRIDDDKKFMARALELAANGMGHTRPNPMVGAVLVKDGEIIGEGWHEFYGGPHAEVNAFADCRADPAGATLYVTLEPCCHYGKTPPCADLIASKNLERVVVAMQDPNPLVSGKGIRKLKDAGIFVTTGVMEKEAQVLNEVFMKFITEKKPFVLYKSAVSMDGKTACHTGKSQWISSEESREEVRTLRGLYAAVMAGAGTIAADDPLLTARTEGLEDPVCIIADGKLSVSMESRVFGGDSRVIVLTTSSAEPEKVKALQSKGIEVIFADSDTEGCVDLEAAMIGLAVKGIDSILLEGGAETAAAAFEAGIVDKIRFYMAPILIGGKDAPGAIGGTGAALIPEAVQLENIHTERSGVDLVVEGYVKKRKKVPAERPLPEKFKADISGKKGSTAVENKMGDQEPEKVQEEIKEPAKMEKAAEKIAEAQEARLPEGQA